jgi:hypothetical protein
LSNASPPNCGPGLGVEKEVISEVTIRVARTMAAPGRPRGSSSVAFSGFKSLRWGERAVVPSHAEDPP